MLARIRFHTDENVGNLIAKGLILRGINVTTTPQANLIGVSDEAQLAFAWSQRRVIFTQDKDFLRLNQSGEPHAGIVYCSKQSRSIGEVTDALYLIWECMTPDEMIQRVEFI
ncbi:MAG: DUF5615 family PIN-like protein [Cyanobacteria bacterium J06555_13]